MFAYVFTMVFRNWRYAMLALITALFVFAFATWLPNLRLLASVVSDTAIPLVNKASLALDLIASITTNFTVLSASYTIAIALLTGINIAFIVYLMARNKQLAIQDGATGILGIVSGTFGIGCAACGSLILTALLGTVGGTGIVTILSFHGGEFGILGVVLLAVAMYLLANRISTPVVCEIPITKP